jgi:threonine/homoserine/homoserine lactone efflux protein
MTIGEYFSFLGGAGLLLTMPGPTNAFLMSAGAHRAGGIGLAWPVLIAYGTVIIPLVLLQEFFGAWLTGVEATLKSLSTLLLAVLAVRMWRSASKATGIAPGVIGPREIFASTLVNPKGLVLAFAVFPPLDSVPSVAAKSLTFAALVFFAATVWIGIGRSLAAGGTPAVQGRVVRASAVIVGLFAVYLGGAAIAAIGRLAGHV